MPQEPRMTLPTLRLLSVLMEDPLTPVYGLESFGRSDIRNDLSHLLAARARWLGGRPLGGD